MQLKHSGPVLQETDKWNIAESPYLSKYSKR